jgi:hypothetical protein
MTFASAIIKDSGMLNALLENFNEGEVVPLHTMTEYGAVEV